MIKLAEKTSKMFFTLWQQDMTELVIAKE